MIIVEHDNADMNTISNLIALTSMYIDEHIFCDLVGQQGKSCDELLNLKATAMNLLTEAEAYCNKAISIATKTEQS